MQFQFYPSWRVAYNKIQDEINDYAWYDYTLCLGPFQFRWRGKPWCTHLRRSPEYQSTVKEILLENLNAQKYTHTRP